MTEVVDLRYPAGDLLVVSGLPGSGKTTLIRRAVAPLDAAGVPVRCVDSQDSRLRLERRLPGRVPYGLYRPVARLLHFAALRRALRAGGSVVVHDSGRVGLVRRWLARGVRRRGGALHLLLLVVEPAVALEGQMRRGRRVPRRVFARHRRAMGRLVAGAAAGRLPRGVDSVAVLDREAADTVRVITFG
ncbi:AAA family ATPase [Streptomyces sp. ET3-23]|uniref:AAA family ATPase n=1 Tax=Streptomyces sp. ET3-23 TaxID=2885643 RepID=UPI001D0F7D85|nr:AAA family ATPase [Streptomyces sp. ET3-23]MCC2277521.1 AAA family ATPase [Streptomyces sp. ET3-23]